jgi:hypothetical protein
MQSERFASVGLSRDGPKSGRLLVTAAERPENLLHWNRPFEAVDGGLCLTHDKFTCAAFARISAGGLRLAFAQPEIRRRARY